VNGTELAAEGAPRVVDRRDTDVDAERLVSAVRDPTDDLLSCPTPGPAHDHLGWLHPGVALNRRAAFAAVARSCGETAPQLDDLRSVAAELRALDTASTDLVAVRERAATVGAERDRLREQVATLRGAVRARREAGLDASDALDELTATAARLSEVTTEAAAARQALDRARETARDAYDRRERRLALQDRAANLQRAARSTLADRVRPDVEAALEQFDERSLADAPDPLVAVAAATVATFDAPVVYELAFDVLPPENAARAFGTPVVRL
jgi:cell division septum initiation protein DivIVA